MNGLDAIAYVAERKIQEALEAGAFDNLPGMGRPLEIDDLSHLPPDMRMAYTILKNGGFLEKEPERGAATGMKELLAAVPDEGRVYGKMQRLKVMMHRVRRLESRFLPEKSHKTQAELEDSPYLEKLVGRV